MSVVVASVLVVSPVTLRLSPPPSFLGFGDSARRDERGGAGLLVSGAGQGGRCRNLGADV